MSCQFFACSEERKNHHKLKILLLLSTYSFCETDELTFVLGANLFSAKFFLKLVILLSRIVFKRSIETFFSNFLSFILDEAI